MTKPLRDESLVSFRRDHAQTIGRAALAHVRARTEKTSPAEYAARAWPNDPDVQLVLRAAAPPLDMTSAAALVQVALAVAPLLTPFSGAAKLFSQGVQVNLGRGAVTVPGAGTVGVKFVGDGKPKPVVQGATTGARLDPHKIAGITVASAELYSLEGSDALLRMLLAESAGPVLDAAVFSANAASADAPAGILNGIAPLAANTGGAGANVTDAFLEDLKTLAAAVAPVAGSSQIKLVVNPVSGLSAAYRVPMDVEARMIFTSAIPAGTSIAVVPTAIASSLGVPTFETNEQATLAMNDAPAPGLMADANVRSLWQTASVGIKMILEATWARRSNQGVAWIQGGVW